MSLKDKRIVVTGGATGIGAATAIRCASEGASVVIADLNERSAQQTVVGIKANGGNAWFVSTDVSSESDVARLMEKAENHLGGVNTLVTAAGIARDSLVPVDELLKESWDKTIDINLTGAFIAVKYGVPLMRRTGSGTIVLIASGAGVRGGSSMVAYGASKGGVNGLGMTLEPILARENIRVNVLCPGNISTPLKLGIIEEQAQRVGDAARRKEQIAGLGTPDGVARVISFLVSDDADYIRGTLFTR